MRLLGPLERRAGQFGKEPAAMFCKGSFIYWATCFAHEPKGKECGDIVQECVLKIASVNLSKNSNFVSFLSGRPVHAMHWYKKLLAFGFSFCCILS